MGILSAIPVVITGIGQALQGEYSLRDVSLHVLFAVLSLIISISIWFVYQKISLGKTLVNNLSFLLLFTSISLTGHFGGELTHGEGYLTSSSSQEDLHSGHKDSSTPVTHVVEIKQMKFVPETVTAKPGDTVLFINKDFLPHNAVESGSGRWSSPKLLPSDSWKLVVVSEADYHCSYHMVMKGHIKLVKDNH